MIRVQPQLDPWFGMSHRIIKQFIIKNQLSSLLKASIVY